MRWFTRRRYNVIDGIGISFASQSFAEGHIFTGVLVLLAFHGLSVALQTKEERC